jgi:hypothetical protein
LTVRDLFVPLLFLSGAASVAVFFLCDKLGDAVPLETAHNGNMFFNAFICSFLAGLTMAIFTVPRPSLPSWRFLFANTLVTSIAVGVSTFVGSFVLSSSLNNSFEFQYQFEQAGLVASSVLVVSLIALARPVDNDPTQGLLWGLLSLGGWVLVIVWALGATFFEARLWFGNVFGGGAPFDSNFKLVYVIGSETLFLSLVSVPVAIAARGSRDASVLISKRNPKLSRDGQSLVTPRRVRRLMPVAGWLAATALIAWNLSIMQRDAHAEDSNFQKLASNYWQTTRPEKLQMDCSAGSTPTDLALIAPGRFYEVARCQGYVAVLRIISVDGENNEAVKSFLNSAGLVMVDENFNLINSSRQNMRYAFGPFTGPMVRDYSGFATTELELGSRSLLLLLWKRPQSMSNRAERYVQY